MVAHSHFPDERGQLAEQIGQDDSTESVEKGSYCYLADSTRLQVVAHEEESGGVSADPILIVSVLLGQNHVLPAVDRVHGRHPKFVLFVKAEPQAALDVHVEKQKEHKFAQLEDHLDVTLRVHVPNDSVQTKDPNELERTKQFEA